MSTEAFISFLLILFVSCDDKRQNFDKAVIPLSPVNFVKVNSAYDDYNSDLSISWNSKHFSLLFSTNRYTSEDFDFIQYNCEAIGDLVTGEFEIAAEWENCSLADSINSKNNELGPFFTYDPVSEEFIYSGNNTKRFFYTTDINGNNNIYYCYYTTDEDDILPAGDPIELTAINSGFDDGYLTIHPDENANRETIYFTSNRDNTYDIYRAVSEENKLIDQSPNPAVNNVEQLSSIADDKCPYISGNMMVFASDRNGGFGGFDLWYSIYNGHEWSEPVNFGERINTEFNEYRPIIIATDKEGFLNDLMIFSSDRPGGKGRFDLYYVGMSILNK